MSPFRAFAGSPDSMKQHRRIKWPANCLLRVSQTAIMQHKHTHTHYLRLMQLLRPLNMAVF